MPAATWRVLAEGLGCSSAPESQALAAYIRERVGHQGGKVEIRFPAEFVSTFAAAFADLAAEMATCRTRPDVVTEALVGE